MRLPRVASAATRPRSRNGGRSGSCRRRGDRDPALLRRRHRTCEQRPTPPSSRRARASRPHWQIILGRRRIDPVGARFVVPRRQVIRPGEVRKRATWRSHHRDGAKPPRKPRPESFRDADWRGRYGIGIGIELTAVATTMFFFLDIPKDPTQPFTRSHHSRQPPDATLGDEGRVQRRLRPAAHSLNSGRLSLQRNALQAETAGRHRRQRHPSRPVFAGELNQAAEPFPASQPLPAGNVNLPISLGAESYKLALLPTRSAPRPLACLAANLRKAWRAACCVDDERRQA
jgi:hypothetical protein